MEGTTETMQAWQKEYNESRPRRAHGERTTNEFAHEIATSGDLMGSETAENSPYIWYRKTGPLNVVANSRKLTLEMVQKNRSDHFASN